MRDARPSRRRSGSSGARSQRAGGASFAQAQRFRIRNSAYEVACEHGYAGTSVALIVARAGVSRTTFYDCFTGAEDCYVAVLEQALADVAQVVVPAYEGRGSWSQRLRTALEALLMFLEEEPAIASLLLLDAPGVAAASVLDCRARVLECLRGVVEEGRSQARAPQSVPPLMAEGLVGGALAVIQARLAAHPPGRLGELASPLMGMIVLPYLGPAAARREQARPAPARPKRAARLPSRLSAFEGLEIRLTYRTLRALQAIAVNPGASNRDIGAAAAISDKGQVSKLLARLQAHGLVRNTSVRRGGTPNAWRLTPLGEELGRAMAPAANGTTSGPRRD